MKIPLVDSHYLTMVCLYQVNFSALLKLINYILVHNISVGLHRFALFILICAHYCIDVVVVVEINSIQFKSLFKITVIHIFNCTTMFV